ncbi:MAG TPA: hypothetical protein VN616_07465 [Puia sp.]|nr:hypothetical protein [Puia sp.]
MSKQINFNLDDRKKLKQDVDKWATAVAGMFVPTECVIVKRPEKKEQVIAAVDADEIL